MPMTPLPFVRRSARRLIALVVSCALVGACGGSSFRTASSSATTTTLSAEDQRWVTAAREGLLTDPEKPSEVTPADGTCVAEATISVVTVARLQAAGVTIGDLRNANELPNDLYGSLSDETRHALGAAVQRCGIGRMLAPDLVRGVQPGAPLSETKGLQKCLADALMSPKYQVLVAAMMLLSSPGAREASETSEILVACIDWAALLQGELKFKLSAAERVCINRRAHTDAAFKRVLVPAISGADEKKTDKQRLGSRLGQLAISCLTPEHFMRLANS